MQVTVWGCRGSLATPGAETVRYGGNTSCVEVQLDDGTLLVLDAGTGIRPLGLKLEESTEPIHLLLTHLHLDHLEGLGFFMPIWHAEREVHIWGPRSPLRALQPRVARYFSPPLFPVDINDIPARLTFHDVPEGPWELGSALIEAGPVTHPGPTVGFRIAENDTTFAYIPDHEPDIAGDLATSATPWVSGIRVAGGVDLLFHDAQYFESEYEHRVGWGHSSVAAAVMFARRAEVGRLVLFHHDPLHTDTDLVELETRARELWSDDETAPELAREGLTIEPARGLPLSDQGAARGAASGGRAQPGLRRN
jgi:phosphoribosyl 1,2-cyclic phosphodiesterase